MSQHHSSLAVDLGSWNGIGLFDISGNTGTMRPNLTGLSILFALDSVH
jgi:hypothetical protein